MSHSIAIQANGLNVSYRVFTNSSEKLEYLVDAVIAGNKKNKNARYVHAIKNLSLKIQKGEKIGIIGRNGAGKSTLIKSIIASAKENLDGLEVNGIIHNLLPGSVSFSEDLSVKQNAENIFYERGLINREIEKLVDEIELFLELDEYFYQPVKNLSLGMRVRSEFAVATVCKPDILLVDEAIGAGDIYWTEKLALRMDALCKEGVTLILVSHSIGQVLRYCDRVIWLERGFKQLDGPALDVCTKYESFLETLSWKYDDLDDLSINAQDTINEFHDRLKETGQQVIRWPGLGEIKIEGIVINGKNDTKIKINVRDEFSMKLIFDVTEQANGRYRFLVTFWANDGKRYAVFENDFIHADRLQYGRALTFRRKGLHLKPGNYFLTVSAFKVSSENTPISEKMSRQDSIYKSFNVELISDDHIDSFFKYTGNINNIKKISEN